MALPLVASNFDLYPGYTGTLVTGTVGPMTTAGTTQTFYYSLTGVDPACDSGAGTAGNSCGIHIHEGMTCTDHTLIGGHYYNGGADPWKTVSYTSDSYGATSGEWAVDTGYVQMDVDGKAFVVHDYTGARIACAVLKTPEQPQEYPLVASPIASYPGYTGPLMVGGSVGPMTTLGTAQFFYYSLTGADPDCASGASTAGNSCGIHIHEGMTCDVHSSVGGHYYDDSALSSDPWASVVYTAFTGWALVETGKNAAEVEGRAFVVHDKNGDRIGCQTLKGSVLTASAFVPYYTYSGALAVGGTVGPMTYYSAPSDPGIMTQTFYYSLTGVDTACDSGAGTAGNSCGIHIHAGSSCLTDAFGHYYNTSSDPWKTISYTSVGTSASGTVEVQTGLDMEALNGKAFIVHNYDGGRIGCALLQTGADLDVGNGVTAPPAVLAEGFVQYYTYSGALEVSGTVGPMSTDSTSISSQTFSFDLTGVDPDCVSGASTASNSCGIHIHEARTCTANANGHYYNTGSDPWASVVYETGKGYLTVPTGLSVSDINGRAMIIHNKAGGRIACAILGVVSPVVLTTAGEECTNKFGIYPGYTGTLAVTGTVGPMMTAGATQTFYYSLTGVDTACDSGAGTAGNSCGVHIHEGMTCTDHTLIGGHYYKTENDPWKTVSYTAVNGAASGSFEVETGVSAQDAEGRAFVVHDYTGARIACALLQTGAPLEGSEEPALLAASFVPYYTYSPVTYATRGTFGPMTSVNGVQTFTVKMTDVDPGCATGGCGIHVHEGRTCEGDTLGHYWNQAEMGTDDQWVPVKYYSDDAEVAYTITTELTAADLNGRAVTVHDSSGDRIACAILGVVNPSPTTCTNQQGDPITTYKGRQTRYWLSMEHFTPVLAQGPVVLSQRAGPAKPAPGLETHQGDWVVAMELQLAGLSTIHIETVDPKTLLNTTALPAADARRLTTLRVSAGGKTLASGDQMLLALNTTLAASRLSSVAIGSGFAEQLEIKTNGLHLRVTSAKANKFVDEKLQVLGLHLDLDFLAFDEDAVAGALPEMWGLRPMSEKTKLLLDKPAAGN